MARDDPFWRRKTLSEMTSQEWESLCDGCGKCCVVLLEDAEDGSIHRTDVACRLLDLKTIRCLDYANRRKRVLGCVKLTPDNVKALGWMPDTCAYRLVAEGRDLFDWHPLKTGDRDSTHDAAISVKGALISELDIDEDALETRIVDGWNAQKRG